MRRETIKVFVFLLLSIVPFSLCFGGDERSGPAEVYLMFDGSLSMQDSQEKAAEWVSEYIADKILQENDSLTIWSVADEPVLEFSSVIGSQEDTDTIKTILSSIKLKSNAGNYGAAFNELQKKIIPNSQYAHAFVILVTGISGTNASLSGAETANMLRYSKSMDFPGWKVMIVGQGIEQKIKSAAAAYMNSQR